MIHRSRIVLNIHHWLGTFEISTEKYMTGWNIDSRQSNHSNKWTTHTNDSYDHETWSWP